MPKNLKTHFFAGILVLAPLFLTVLVILYLVRLTDAFIVNPVFQLLPGQWDVTFKIVLAKAAIAFFVAFFVTLIGLGAEKFFVKQFLSAGESVLKGIPVLNKVYGSIQEIAQAFFGDKKGVFKRVVFVEYPRKGIYAMGFVTQDKRWELHRATGKEMITVFVPSPPNPATGFFVFVPKDEAIEASLTVEEGLKLVISGGAVVPPVKE